MRHGEAFVIRNFRRSRATLSLNGGKWPYRPGMRANTHLIRQPTFAILDGCRDALPDQVPGEVPVLAWIGACLSVALIGNGGLMIATRDVHLRFQNWALFRVLQDREDARDRRFGLARAGPVGWKPAPARQRRVALPWHHSDARMTDFDFKPIESI